MCCVMTAVQAVPSPIQIIHGLCDQPPEDKTVQRIADNDDFPARQRFPEFCVLPPPAHRLGHQICCQCFAVAHPKFCAPDSWPTGAVNVTNFEQVYDIRTQKKKFNIAGNDYTLMFQFCCNKFWLDTRAADEAKLWQQGRLDVWRKINDPNYTFKPRSDEFAKNIFNDRTRTTDLVTECKDFDATGCQQGMEEGACTNEEFANLCKKTCGLCKVIENKPTPSRQGGENTDRKTTGKCSRGQIPQNVCTKPNRRNNAKLRWYFDDVHHECLAFKDRGCQEDNDVGNRYDSYSKCASQCMASDAPTCAANRAPTTDPTTGESLMCEINRSTGTDSCPDGSVCMRGAFFSVCCDKKNEDQYATSYKAVCKNGLAHVTFIDGALVRPLLGATCDSQHKFCPDNSRCVKSKKFAHCCKL